VALPYENVITGKKQAGGQLFCGKPELAKRALNFGGVFRTNVDPNIESVGGSDMTVNPDRVPPIAMYSTLFELSDFKNSLKFLASAGVAIEGPSQKFERPQSFLDWSGQPVPNRIVRIRQAHDRKLRAVEPELVEPIVRRSAHNSSLPPN
jgi:hypothetical protein